MKFESVSGAGRCELEIKKSRFIGVCENVSASDEAEAFVASVKAAHPEARHNCFAYTVREYGASKFSDDGEPQGTAGMPMAEVIRKRGITDTVVVVTRYFGGILLGASGLCRAYAAACAGAIDNAGISAYEPFSFCALTCGYSEYAKLEYELRRLGACPESPEFGTDVSLKFRIASSKRENAFRAVSEISAGRCTAVCVCEKYARSKD